MQPLADVPGHCPGRLALYMGRLAGPAPAATAASCGGVAFANSPSGQYRPLVSHHPPRHVKTRPNGVGGWARTGTQVRSAGSCNAQRLTCGLPAWRGSHSSASDGSSSTLTRRVLSAGTSHLQLLSVLELPDWDSVAASRIRHSAREARERPFAWRPRFEPLQ